MILVVSIVNDKVASRPTGMHRWIKWLEWKLVYISFKFTSVCGWTKVIMLQISLKRMPHNSGYEVLDVCRPPGEFQRKKRFLKRLIFAEERLKKVFQSPDLAMKICRKMQRYSLWSGLITPRQGFSQRFVFLSYFFLLEIFYFGQDVTHCTATYVEGARGLPMRQLGVRGSSRGKFFANKSSAKGILGQIYRPQGKKG